jgi:hypothetical protein
MNDQTGEAQQARSADIRNGYPLDAERRSPAGDPPQAIPRRVKDNNGIHSHAATARSRQPG